MKLATLLLALKKASLSAIIKPVSALTAFWTFPSVVFSSFLIGWAAEAAQFFISQGMALAILAWLQTLPEFAVEAVIAWAAGKEPDKLHLVIANLTGSLRLLVGLGWPMIFFTASMFNRRKGNRSLKYIELEDEHSVEVIALAPPLFYWFFIWFKASLTWVDAIVLTFFYVAYIVVLNKIPPQSHEKIEDMEYIPRKILRTNKKWRASLIVGMFVGGGLILYFVAAPFLGSMLALAATFGISQFISVQWIAPFLSEFPEKLSAFNWARRIKTAPMALMNLVSSNINQWTILAAMLPLIVSVSRGSLTDIPFDSYQRMEILLTIAQSLLGWMLLVNMKFSWYESSGIFCLWLVQFVKPETREVVATLYFIWVFIEIVLAVINRKRPNAFRIFPKLLR